MKKLFTILLISSTVSLVNATVHTINVSNTQFSPSNVSAMCGDTIKWVWVSGSHTTTSKTIPSGAGAWDAPINSTSTFFVYKVILPGAYQYVCTPHSPNISGNILVVCSTGTGVPAAVENVFSAAFPNPFTNKITIETRDADMISFYNMMGEKIKNILLKGGPSKTVIETAELNNGIYFYSILKEGVIVETRKIIKNQ